MNRARDEKFMHAALEEAKKALGRTSPNPAVGAVLVVGDRIVSRGHHRGAGRARPRRVGTRRGRGGIGSFHEDLREGAPDDTLVFLARRARSSIG